jgi:hypothetical protein
MRRSPVAFVAVVVFGLLLMPARPAEAQGFWRWLEELSGPEIHGLGFELSGLCWGTTVDSGDPGTREPRSWSANPYCLDKRRDEKWLSIGVQFYALVGDNSLTDDPHDRVDALGFLPTVDSMFSRGIGVGGGVGLRRYSTPAGSFHKPDLEAWLKVRPIALINQTRRTATATQSLRDDWLEFRLGLVFHGSFDEGLFGPGTRALDSETSFVLITAINLVR